MRLTILDAATPDWFPPVESARREPNGLLAVGGDLSPPRLLAAYRRGIFPWYSENEPILWWCPDPRLVFATDRMRVSRRFARWLRHCDWHVDADHAFANVLDACAAPRPRQPTTWIVPEIRAAYLHLHTLGHAHSVEIRNADDELVGGLYGVAMGRMFFGESMFSRSTNASKVALLALAHVLRDWHMPLIDAQVTSRHLIGLGASEMARAAFCPAVQSLASAEPPDCSWADCFSRVRVADLAS